MKLMTNLAIQMIAESIAVSLIVVSLYSLYFLRAKKRESLLGLSFSKLHLSGELGVLIRLGLAGVTRATDDVDRGEHEDAEGNSNQCQRGQAVACEPSDKASDECEHGVPFNSGFIITPVFSARKKENPR
jgi:hypothetical protein